MSTPLPGRASRGSTTGRPIMVLLDTLGRRGSLRILWELRGDPLTFRALQSACSSNPSLVNTRLTELRALSIVAHEPGGYRLTESGRALLDTLHSLQDWSDTWLSARPD